jgi:hypothetical protein
MGWVERFGELTFLHALPSPPSNCLQTPQPNKIFLCTFSLSLRAFVCAKALSASVSHVGVWAQRILPFGVVF